jgi:cell wall-associated NlpC family hydrolase
MPRIARGARLTGATLAATVALTPLTGLVDQTPAEAATTVVPVAKVVKRAQKKTWSQRTKTAWKAVGKAKSRRGMPYVWGATGPRSFDCSGLMVWSYKKAGVGLPRTTHAQYRGIKNKIRWKNLHPGDLVFRSGRGHVGMVVKVKGHRVWMIHAPNSGDVVRIARITKSSFAGAVRPY